MRFRDLLTDDDAVSPVIGVILMVAITVILAAVIAAFVLGLGDTNSVAPNPTFESDYNSTNPDVIQITMTGGDTFTASRVTVAGDSPDASDTWADVSQQNAEISDLSADDEVTAGNRIIVDVTGDAFEMQLVWTAESGDSSSTLFSREGPNA